MVSSGPALVVEDNPLVAMFVSEHLQEAGFSPVTVASFETAAVASAMRPGLALAVVCVERGRANLLALTAHLRRCGVCVILVSETEDLADMPEIVRTAPRLVKPYGPDDLARAVEACANAG